MFTTIKKIILSTCIVFFLTHTAKVEFSPNASQKEQWNFEVYNKSNKPIWISVGYIHRITDPFNNSVINKQKLEGKTKQTQGQKIRAVVNQKEMPIITIWTSQPNLIGTNYTVRRGINVCQNLQKNEPCQKQAFLTWDGEILRPQTGKFGGLPQLFGKPGLTESGLKIINNINQLQIQNVD